MKSHLIALVFALLANAAANIMIKAGMNGRPLDPGRPGELLTAIVTNKLVAGGVILFALNVVCYAYVLSRVPLSLAYPIMTSVGFLIVVGASALLFGESLGALQIGGMVLIIVGVAMVASRLG